MCSHNAKRFTVNAHRCIVSFLPNRFSGFQFISSGSILSAANERSRSRTPLLRRLLSPDMIWYAFCVLYTAIPLLLRVVGDPGDSVFPLSGALIKLLECARYAAVPVVYMAFPPAMPARTELVEVDKDGVQRPKKGTQEVNESDEGDYGVTWSDLVEVMIIYMCDWC